MNSVFKNIQTLKTLITVENGKIHARFATTKKW